MYTYAILYRKAYRSGVVSSTSSPGFRDGVISGLSATFRTGCANAMGTCVIQALTALHINLQRGPEEKVGISTRIGGIRRLLFGWEDEKTDTGDAFKKAAEVRFQSS